MKKNILVLLFFAIPPNSFASNLAAQCSADDIKVVSTPTYLHKKSKAKFNYRYQFKKGKEDAPTIIVIPGGPGQALIGQTKIIERFPADYSLILTDPRGIGCNDSPYGKNFPFDYFSTEQIANDMLTMIQSLNLKNYFIMGISYGTIVATQLADMSERAKVPPKAVIYSGTFGTGFDEVTWFNGLINVYEKTVQRLPEVEKKYYLSLKAPPLGVSQLAWGKFIENRIPFGMLKPKEAPGETALMTDLLLLASKDAEKVKEKILASEKDEMETTYTQNWKNLKVAVSCNEVFGAETHRLHFEDGQFTVVKKERLRDFDEKCLNYNLKKKFDSAQFKLKMPLYYLQGQDDPFTPVWQAIYHFENQSLASRQMVIVKYGGHNLAFNELFKAGCHSKVWEAITSLGSIESAMKSCPLEFHFWK